MGWWSKVWTDQVEDWVCGFLDEAQIPDGSPSGEILPETAYLNVFLKSARVVNVRQGLTRFYGAVHSFIRVPHRSQPGVEFNAVITPTALKNIDAKSIDHVVQFNNRLLGPVPYFGGDLEMQVGLFSIASSNLAAPYLTLLEMLSEKAGVAFISSALPLAGTILEGVKLLAGSNGDHILEIGLSMTQDRPRQGWCVAMRAPKKNFALRDLVVDPSDYRLLDKQGKVLADYPYLVLEIRGGTQRGDWFNIPELAKAYSYVQELYRDPRANEKTVGALEVFRRVALTCNDLTPQDATSLADRVESMYRELSRPKPSRRGHEGVIQVNSLPDLKEIGLYSG